MLSNWSEDFGNGPENEIRIFFYLAVKAAIIVVSAEIQASAQKEGIYDSRGCPMSESRIVA
ncbi:hypothetical protein HGP16_31620 [Rhizobium sp. P40RR-XXII]|uniref:hypothetical protein n=1 Tax=unclassified Rhizobium TaxID=2613769 RepID=UPI0014563F3D|nr:MULTISPECIES: hypothetical protein [unclassified Rhizobium]NLR89131.1 hypothetical protein [Rhizobium sp. P28RR-XV]NLS21051.1 hypothetical protein [Rhizobium sp. P40RR-XXII]